MIKVALLGLACAPLCRSWRQIGSALGQPKNNIVISVQRLLALGLLRQDEHGLAVNEEALLACLLHATPLLAPATRSDTGESQPALPGAAQLVASVPHLAGVLHLVDRLRLGPALAVDDARRTRVQLQQELGWP